MDQQQVQDRYAWARQIAAEAGRLTLEFFQRPVAVERKSDNTPVTEADRAAESLLRQRIEAAFPDDAIVGEEFPAREGRSPFRWILDPIDGTKSFVAGTPLYATLVAVQHHGQSVAGVIEIPALGESVAAVRGGGAWHYRDQQPPVPARVSGCARLEDAIFLTSERRTFDEQGAADVYFELERRSWVTRTWGDGYGYFLVATGRADVMVDACLSLWDAAALQPVLEEAGGRFSDWSGAARVDGGQAIGCCPGIWEAVLDVTRRGKRSV